MEMEKEEGEGALEKYHNTEGVQLKKKKKNSLRPSFSYTGLIFSPSLHLTLQTKGYTEKLMKN